MTCMMSPHANLHSLFCCALPNCLVNSSCIACVADNPRCGNSSTRKMLNKHVNIASEAPGKGPTISGKLPLSVVVGHHTSCSSAKTHPKAQLTWWFKSRLKESGWSRQENEFKGHAQRYRPSESHISRLIDDSLVEVRLKSVHDSGNTPRHVSYRCESLGPMAHAKLSSHDSRA